MKSHSLPALLGLFTIFLNGVNGDPNIMENEGPAPVVDVTSRSVWRDTLNQLPQQGGLFVMFHTPWCHFCKRVKPEFEKAARAYAKWPEEVMKTTLFAHVDCEISNQQCSAAGIYLYPTLSYIDKKGTMREELPLGSRRAESMLADLAKRRRKALPIEVESYEDFKQKRARNLRNCWGERRPITDYSYEHSLCLGMKTANYMVGTNSSLTRINQRFRNAGVGMVQFAYPDHGVLPPELKTKSSACILNQYDFTERECIDLDSSDDKVIDEVGKEWLNSFYETPIVDYGTWEDFYTMKNHDSKKRIVVIAVDNYNPASKQPYVQAGLEKQAGWFTLLIDRENSEMTSLITEMGLTVEESPLIAFRSSLDDHAYYPFNSTLDSSSAIDVISWLDDIDNNKVKAQYRPGKEPGAWNYLKREFSGFLRTIRNLRNNVPLSVWMKVVIIGLGFIGSWFALVWFTADMEEKATPPVPNGTERLAPLYEEQAEDDEKSKEGDDQDKRKDIDRPEDENKRTTTAAAETDLISDASGLTESAAPTNSSMIPEEGQTSKNGKARRRRK